MTVVGLEAILPVYQKDISNTWAMGEFQNAFTLVTLAGLIFFPFDTLILSCF